jgi:hypothetical protein
MLTLQDLTTPAGINHLVDVTGGTQSFYNQPQRAYGVMDVANSAIQANPNLKHLKVRVMPNLPNAYYNYDKHEIIMGLVNPDALAHELGHANNLKQEGLYNKVLRVANGVARVNNLAAVPTMLALRFLIQDPDRRDDILKTLAAVSAAAAAPGLLEEASASVGGIRHSPNKLKAMGTMLPGFMAHMATSMAPALIYQAGRAL